MYNKYQKIWNSRYSISPNTKNWKPFKGWDKKDRKHLVLIISIKDKRIVKNIETIQNKLSTYNSYIRFPKGYYHITIKPLGFFNNLKTRPDDYNKEEVNEITKSISNTLSKEKKFEIKLKSINLFNDVVFIQINDKNKLASINRKILSIPNVKILKRDYPNFLSHCTIGTFKSKKIKELIGEIEKFREFNFGKILVDSIQLVIAHWHNTKYPKFELIKKFNLD